MTDVEYTAIRKQEIRAQCLHLFGTQVHVRRLLFEDLALNRDAVVTVFSTVDNSIYALCESETSLRLGDVQRLIKQAGFTPGSYAAPRGDKKFFQRAAYEIFLRAYPGRTKWTPGEEAYYQLLVPYSPALIRLQGVRGPVKRFNPVTDSWQVVYEPARVLTAGRR